MPRKPGISERGKPFIEDKMKEYGVSRNPGTLGKQDPGERVLGEKTAAWVDQVNTKEKGAQIPYRYQASRVEMFGLREGSIDSIEDMHKVSFIKEVIPEIIARKKPDEKIKILDIGGGFGAYAEQLRKSKLGERLEVYTTGLSKKAARREREYAKLKESFINYGEMKVDDVSKYIPGGLNEKSHKNDLKWRSILQLTDFPEFDLIIDTYGEAFYSSQKPKEHYALDSEALKRYLTAVIKKLLPGGQAFIHGVPRSFSDEDIKLVEEEAGATISRKGEGMRVVITK